MRNGRNGATDFLAMFKRLVCLRIQQRIAFLHFKDELTFITVSLEDEHLRSEATLRIKNQYSKFTINFFPKFTAAIFLFTKNKFFFNSKMVMDLRLQRNARGKSQTRLVFLKNAN